VYYREQRKVQRSKATQGTLTYPDTSISIRHWTWTGCPIAQLARPDSAVMVSRQTGQASVGAPSNPCRDKGGGGDRGKGGGCSEVTGHDTPVP
jgi:hypothetical protein